MESPEQALTIGNFQLQSQLAAQSGQGLSISGYIYSDDNEQSLNGRLDLYKRVIDRQQKLSEIPLLEAQLRSLRDGLEQNERLLKDHLEKQQQGIKIPSAEKMQSKNIEVNIEHLIKRIQEGEQAIAKLRAEVA